MSAGADEKKIASPTSNPAGSGSPYVGGKALSAKQRLFVQEYLVDLNACQAAIRAGYSARTAEQQGPRLLQHPAVAAAVESAMADRVERIQVTADNVIAELAKIGFSDIRRMFTPGGNLLPVKDLDDNAAAALSAVEVVTRKVPGGEEAEVEHVAKIKLWDKRQALVDLGKHLGLFKDQVEHSGGITVEIVRLGDAG